MLERLGLLQLIDEHSDRCQTLLLGEGDMAQKAHRIQVFYNRMQDQNQHYFMRRWRDLKSALSLYYNAITNELVVSSLKSAEVPRTLIGPRNFSYLCRMAVWRCAISRSFWRICLANAMAVMGVRIMRMMGRLFRGLERIKFISIQARCGRCRHKHKEFRVCARRKSLVVSGASVSSA